MLISSRLLDMFIWSSENHCGLEIRMWSSSEHMGHQITAAVKGFGRGGGSSAKETKRRAVREVQEELKNKTVSTKTTRKEEEEKCKILGGINKIKRWRMSIGRSKRKGHYQARSTVESTPSTISVEKNHKHRLNQANQHVYWSPPRWKTPHQVTAKQESKSCYSLWAPRT